jgi:hypothetical protein
VDPRTKSIPALKMNILWDISNSIPYLVPTQFQEYIFLPIIFIKIPVTRPNSWTYYNWDISLKSFPSCYSQSPLPTDFTQPPPPPVQKWCETGIDSHKIFVLARQAT